MQKPHGVGGACVRRTASLKCELRCSRASHFAIASPRLSMSPSDHSPTPAPGVDAKGAPPPAPAPTFSRGRTTKPSESAPPSTSDLLVAPYLPRGPLPIMPSSPNLTAASNSRLFTFACRVTRPRRAKASATAGAAASSWTMTSKIRPPSYARHLPTCFDSSGPKCFSTMPLAAAGVHTVSALWRSILRRTERLGCVLHAISMPIESSTDNTLLAEGLLMDDSSRQRWTRSTDMALAKTLEPTPTYDGALTLWPPVLEVGPPKFVGLLGLHRMSKVWAMRQAGKLSRV
mmetsp:Transcript_34369/g.87441  ORF Transcript_34369/g.87441 Transcript_34369/m.87441 type:complete len:288 (+) Transcript_34369:36-899(+)